MPSTAWLGPALSHPWVRRATDSAFVHAANRRVRQLDRQDAPRVQLETLFRLVRKAAQTRFGQDHQFHRIESLNQYQRLVPIRNYEQFWTEYWQSAYPRLDGVTWPGQIPYYALSSGTTSGATKYIPVSREMLRSNQKAAYTTMSLFRHFRPRSSTFNGKFFFLGGSTELRKQDDGSLAGDLSGIAALELAECLRGYTYPPLELARIGDWEVKMPRMAEQVVREPITALSGIPSWMLLLFDQMKKVSGKSTISEIWPELRLLVHGGIKFDPYRELFLKEVGSDKVTYIETYPCSEGFVATEDPRYQLLRLVPDHDIFFEFVPVAELDQERPTRHYLGNVEVGVQYAPLLTTCAGLWSFLVGDTIVFEQTNPPLIRFTGRTKYFLSAFGEHLISEEVEKGVAAAARATGASVVDFHVGPVFPQDPSKPGYHLYLVEYHGQPPTDTEQFAREIDKELCRINEDYDAHRVGDLSMLPPKVQVVPAGQFGHWLKQRGKSDIQAKVPRMDITGQITSELAQLANRVEEHGIE